MTHEYTLLLGGVVVTGTDAPDATAIAWAADTVLAIGTDDAVRSISRGDSRFAALRGAVVVAAGAAASLVVGGPADLDILDRDPSATAGDTTTPARRIAAVRAGRVVEGALPPGRPAMPTHAR